MTSFAAEGRTVGTEAVVQQAPRRPPRDHLVTREEALAAMEQAPLPARRFVAHLLSRAWAEGSAGGELGADPGTAHHND